MAAPTQQSRNVYSYASALDASTGVRKIRFLRWVGATTAAHELVVQDTDGNEIAKAVADASNYSETIPLMDWYDGLTVSTMDSGTLYEYRG